MQPRRIVRFVYLSNDTHARRVKPHQQRDESASFELIGALRSFGFVHDGADRLFLNHPGHPKDRSLAALSTLRLTERDVLLLTTRPPLDDKGGKQPLRPSRSSAEALVFKALRESCFEHCSRANIGLLPDLASQLTVGYRNRSDIDFSRRADPLTLSTGTYAKVYGHKEDSTQPWNRMMTAGYLTNVSLGPGRPRLLAAFSTAGTTTLAWSFLLSQRLEILEQALQRPSFSMAEIQTAPLSPNLHGYSFCSGWSISLIAHHAIGD